jgi:hypothetical protein
MESNTHDSPRSCGVRQLHPGSQCCRTSTITRSSLDHHREHHPVRDAVASRKLRRSAQKTPVHRGHPPSSSSSTGAVIVDRDRRSFHVKHCSHQSPHIPDARQSVLPTTQRAPLRLASMVLKCLAPQDAQPLLPSTIQDRNFGATRSGCSLF